MTLYLDPTISAHPPTVRVFATCDDATHQRQFTHGSKLGAGIPAKCSSAGALWCHNVHSPLALRCSFEHNSDTEVLTRYAHKPTVVLSQQKTRPGP